MLVLVLVGIMVFESERWREGEKGEKREGEGREGRELIIEYRTDFTYWTTCKINLCMLLILLYSIPHTKADATIYIPKLRAMGGYLTKSK